MSANRIALAALMLLAGGCDKLASDGRSQRSGDTRIRVEADPSNDSAVTPDGVGAPMAWRRREEASGPIALYGADGAPPVFAIRCDKARRGIELSRAGTGSDVSIEIGSSGQRYDGRAINRDGPRVAAHVPDTDPYLDRLGARGTVFRVATGGAPVEIPSGVAIRRVVEECRAPPAPVVEPTPEVAGNEVEPAPTASPPPVVEIR